MTRNDPTRLGLLHRTALLDSAPERVYDDIVQLLATGLDVPIVMVNLLDERRDWFKARVGLPLSESPVETSFCEAFFGVEDDLIVAEDTLQSARFATHPLVVGPPHIRFYCGARLTLESQTVGTLCAYDVKPRRVTAEQLSLLRLQAGAAMALLRGRLAGAAG
jgi:GAF domain-containing protein